MTHHDITVATAIQYGIAGPDAAWLSRNALLDAAGQVDQYARAWLWSNVEAQLDKAYAAIGGDNPGTGYEYHAGTHPVQRAMQA